MAATHDILRDLWTGAGLPLEHLEHASISLPRADQHVLPSSYRIGAAAQACIAATALAASLYRQLTTAGRPVSIEVDARHAALEFASERFSRQCPTKVHAVNAVLSCSLDRAASDRSTMRRCRARLACRLQAYDGRTCRCTGRMVRRLSAW